MGKYFSHILLSSSHLIQVRSPWDLYNNAVINSVFKNCLKCKSRSSSAVKAHIQIIKSSNVPSFRLIFDWNFLMWRFLWLRTETTPFTILYNSHFRFRMKCILFSLNFFSHSLCLFWLFYWIPRLTFGRVETHFQRVFHLIAFARTVKKINTCFIYYFLQLKKEISKGSLDTNITESSLEFLLICSKVLSSPSLKSQSPKSKVPKSRPKGLRLALKSHGPPTPPTPPTHNF